MVCRRPPCFKVHVINKGIGQRHLESLGRSLAVFVDTHSAQLAQVRVVEASVKHVEAGRIPAMGREAKGFFVVEGSAVEAFQRRKTVCVEAADLCRTAHCGYSVTQSCRDTTQSVKVEKKNEN